MQERIDAGAAETAWATAKLGGSNAELHEFVPNWTTQPAKEPQSVESMIAVVRSLQKKKD